MTRLRIRQGVAVPLAAASRALVTAAREIARPDTVTEFFGAALILFVVTTALGFGLRAASIADSAALDASKASGVRMFGAAASQAVRGHSRGVAPHSDTRGEDAAAR